MTINLHKYILTLSTVSIMTTTAFAADNYCPDTSSFKELFESNNLDFYYRLNKKVINSTTTEYELTVDTAGIVAYQLAVAEQKEDDGEDIVAFDEDAIDQYILCSESSLPTGMSSDDCDDLLDEQPDLEGVALSLLDLGGRNTTKQSAGSTWLDLKLYLDSDSSAEDPNAYYSKVTKQCASWGGTSSPEWQNGTLSGKAEIYACVDPSEDGWGVVPGLFAVDFNSSNFAYTFATKLNLSSLYTTDFCNMGACDENNLESFTVKTPSITNGTYSSSVLETGYACNWDQNAGWWDFWSTDSYDICEEIKTKVVSGLGSKLNEKLVTSDNSLGSSLKKALPQLMSSIMVREGAAALVGNAEKPIKYTALNSTAVFKSVAVVNDNTNYASSCGSSTAYPVNLKGGLRVTWQAPSCATDKISNHRPVITEVSGVSMASLNKATTFKVEMTDADSDLDKVDWEWNYYGSSTITKLGTDTMSSQPESCGFSSKNMTFSKASTMYVVRANIYDKAGNKTTKEWYVVTTAM